MKDGQRLVPGHVDLVQDAESAFFRAHAYRSLPEGHFFSVEGVGADQARGVRPYVEGYIPYGTAEKGGQVLAQKVLAGSLRSCQKQIPSREKDSHRFLPDGLSVVEGGYLRDPVRKVRICRISFPEFCGSCQQFFVNAFFFQ